MMALFILMAVSLLWSKPYVLALVLIFISTIKLIISKSKEALILFLVVGFSGALAEAIAIFFGTWMYAKLQLFGIPIWLPVLWGLAAITIRNINIEIHSFVKEKM